MQLRQLLFPRQAWRWSQHHLQWLRVKTAILHRLQLCYLRGILHKRHHSSLLQWPAQHLEVETFLSSLCEQCSQPQLLNQAPQPYRATTAAGQALHSLDCCILFTATTRNTILHRPLKVPCCFVSNLWTRELWNDRLTRNQCSWFSGGNVVCKRNIGLFTRNSSFFMIRRCSRYTSRTTSGSAALLLSALLHLHQGLHVRHLLLAEGLLLLPTLHFRIRASKVSFCTLQRHARLADASLLSLQLLDLASQSVQLDDVCLQAVRLLLHELNCSCHRNSSPELIRKVSLSCKSSIFFSFFPAFFQRFLLLFFPAFFCFSPLFFAAFFFFFCCVFFLLLFFLCELRVFLWCIGLVKLLRPPTAS